MADTSSLAVEVIKDFIALDPETQPRNVTAWTPVVTDVLRGSIEFEEEAVCPILLLCYPPVPITSPPLPSFHHIPLPHLIIDHHC